jgi:hypothetical protein
MSDGITDETSAQPEPVATPQENVDPAKEFNQYMGTAVDRPDKEFVAAQPAKPAKKYSKERTEKLYKEAAEWQKKKDAARKEKETTHSFKPSTSYRMKNGKIEAQEGPPGSSPARKKKAGGTPRYKQMFEDAKKKQLESRTQESPLRDKECTFKPTTKYKVKNGQVQEDKDAPAKQAKKAGSQPRYKLLYEDSLKRQEAHKTKRAEEDKECTFTPAVNANNDKLANLEGTVVERLYNPDHNLEQHLERAMLKEEGELKGCTFRPQISSTGASVIDEQDAQTTFNRLYEDAGLAKQRKTMLRQEVMNSTQVGRLYTHTLIHFTMHYIHHTSIHHTTQIHTHTHIRTYIHTYTWW